MKVQLNLTGDEKKNKEPYSPPEETNVKKRTDEALKKTPNIEMEVEEEEEFKTPPVLAAS
jgi:hypothetical protein